MPRQFFVTLPVKDVRASKAFFESLGFAFDPNFTGDDAACLVIEQGVAFAMLGSHKRFAELAPHPIADANAVTQALFAMSCASRAEVDDLVAKAIAAGGRTVDEATDHGFMYDHGFKDLDGHCWGVFWMDPTHGK